MPGIPNVAERSFGFAVASGDFDGDGYGDLSVGAPNDEVGFVTDAGTAVVVYGALFSAGFGDGDPGYWSGVVP